VGIAAVEIRRCGSLRFRLRCPRGQRSSPRLSRRSGPALMSRRASRRLSPRSRNARGKRASARADATPSELALSASASACGSPDAGLREQPASRRRCISMVSADLVPFWRRDGIHAGTGSRLAEAKARGAEAVRIAPVGARNLRTLFVRRRCPIVPHPGASSAPVRRVRWWIACVRDSRFPRWRLQPSGSWLALPPDLDAAQARDAGTEGRDARGNTRAGQLTLLARTRACGRRRSCCVRRSSDRAD